jgi:hypothetical protein
VFASRSRPAPGPALALAVSLALHLLAALLWMQERRPPISQAPRTISIQLRPLAPARAREEPLSPSLPRPVPRLAKPGPQSAAPMRSPALPPAAVRTPQPAVQPADRREAQAPAQGLEEPPAPSDVNDAIRAQSAADGGFAAGMARRQAGRIDRELRQGKSGVPNEPDTPIGRLRRGLEGARADRSMSVYEDSYTGPDGTITYRKHIGKGTICRRSGSVNPLGMRGMLFGGDAGDVECPSGVQWKRD